MFFKNFNSAKNGKREKKENSRIEKIELPPKICQRSCKICSSDYLQEIHLLRKNGAEFLQIASIMAEKHNFKISPSSLCTHFQNYNKIKDVVSAEIIKKDLLDEATKKAAQATAIVKLIDRYINILEQNFDAGFIKPNISDLEKLFNIRYKILAGNLDDEGDLVGIFQEAVDKYGVQMKQGVLFGHRPDGGAQRTTRLENSSEQPEAQRDNR